MNFIYLLCHFPFVFMVKVGISNNVKKRQQDINRSLKVGRTIHVCSAKVPLARKWEGTIHGLFAWCRSSWLGGSGKTEWFFIFPAVLLIPLILAIRLFKWILIGLIAIFLFKYFQR